MPERQQTSLRFPLEESVWFEKGQEVDELISLSLDPYITVLDEEEFIVLKGSLELSGEYRHVYDSGEVEAFPVPGRTYMQTTEIRNDGDSEFSHHFPVDITIPKSRIANMEELDIEVESIDYELSEGSKLNLIAEVFVNGVYSETDEQSDDVEVEETSQLETERDEIEEQVEVEEDDEVEVELLDRQDEALESVNVDIVEAPPQNVSEASSNEASQDIDDVDIYEPFSVEARIVPDNKNESIEQENVSSNTYQQLPEIALHSLEESSEKAEVRNIESSSYVIDDYLEDESSQESESSSHHEDAKNKTKKKKDKYKSMSFADFFARKEEEASAKLRVCLVQQGDSIEELADKYDISVQQILRENRLDASHEVYEGQVLYIPSKSVPVIKKSY